MAMLSRSLGADQNAPVYSPIRSGKRLQRPLRSVLTDTDKHRRMLRGQALQQGKQLEVRSPRSWEQMLRKRGNMYLDDGSQRQLNSTSIVAPSKPKEALLRLAQGRRARGSKKDTDVRSPAPVQGSPRIVDGSGNVGKQQRTLRGGMKRR